MAVEIATAVPLEVIGDGFGVVAAFAGLGWQFILGVFLKLFEEVLENVKVVPHSDILELKVAQDKGFLGHATMMDIKASINHTFYDEGSKF